MSRVPIPVVRLFVPCAEVRCDTTVLPNRYMIVDPLYAHHPAVGKQYPCRLNTIWLFCQFSDATGPHEFTLEQSWDIDAEVRILHRFRVEFGSDRLAVRNF